MSKRKRKSRTRAARGERARSRRRAARARDPAVQMAAPDKLKAQGMSAFRAGRISDAIQAWEKLDTSDPRLAAALAEAHFRYALSQAVAAEQVASLQRAVELAPEETRYWYHLGLALHHSGGLDNALQAYEQSLTHHPPRREAAFVAALAAMEASPPIALSDLPWIPDEDRQALAPLAALLGDGLSSQPDRSDEASPIRSLVHDLTRLLDASSMGPDVLWRGLGMLARGDSAGAHKALSTAAQLRLPAKTEAVRNYYLGVVAAQRGDLSTALAAWQHARAAGLDTPWLVANLVQLYATQALADAEAGDWPVAASKALAGFQLTPGDATLAKIAIVGLDQKAHAAAAHGDWETAVRDWDRARRILADVPGLGSARPILQNLAVACEAVERWEEAAKAWRALLRTRPRRGSRKQSAEARWTWVHQRAIECYQRAGRLDEAITLFRQAVKADPQNVDTRLELAEALLANGQERAARNELTHLLKLRPNHAEALSRLAELYLGMGEWHQVENLLRRALHLEPDNEALQQQMAYFLRQQGQRLHGEGHLAAARRAFEEGTHYLPDDYSLYIDLGRVDLDSERPEAAREDFERALALTPSQPDVYIQILDCWAIERDIEEAQQVLASAEANLHPSSLFYIHAALSCLVHGSQPQLPIPFQVSPSATSESDPWYNLGTELLDRGLAMQPHDPAVWQYTILELMSVQSDLALRCAEQATEHIPGNPELLMMLGILQGLNRQTRQARRTLRRAAKLAQKAGNLEMVSLAETVRREITNPLFPLLMTVGPLLGGLDLE